MSSMLKLLTLAILAAGSLYANTLQEKILEFEKKSIDPRIEILNIKVAHEVELDNEWKGFVVDIKISMQGQTRDVKDIIFSNGTLVTRELMHLSGTSYNDMMEEYTYPTLGSEYYKKESLIAGSMDAKNKVVVFSDPLCPYCIRFAPSLIEQIKAKKDVALFYIHFPLPSHEAAYPLSAGLIKAASQGVKDAEYKLYKAFATNQVILQKAQEPSNAATVLNEVLGTNFTQENLSDETLTSHLEKDMELTRKAGVRGTPTVFVNGKIDKSRQKLQKLLD